MSQITKPIMLDETGQDLVDALEAIPVIAGNKVSVQQLGTATTLVSYITIDGTQYLLAGGVAAGVSSFNNRAGVVMPQSGDYTAEMVGALSDDTEIPSKTSDLTNDSGFITDSYHDASKYDASNPNGYITSSYHDSTKYDASNPNGYITSSYHDSSKQDVISDLSSIRSGASAGSTAVQPAAISDMATKTWVGNQGYLTSAEVSGKEDKTNKVTSLSASSTDTQYPSAKATYDAVEDVREVAEGKTATYVVSKTTNPTFDSTADSIVITSFTDIQGVVHTFDELRLGDNIYVTETDVPDRWVSNVGTANAVCHKLETAKAAVSDVTVNGTSVVSNNVAAVTVPTKTSDITNDSGFITNSALSNYSTTSEMNTAISNHHDSTKYDASNPDGYITNSVSDLTNYSTTTAMNTAISSHHDSTKQNVLVSNDNVIQPLYVDDGELRLSFGNGLHKATDTGALEVEVKSNGGITLASDGISVDTSVVQPKLTAGTNITIENNVISASGGGSGTVTDVQVEGTSVVTSGVANVTRSALGAYTGWTGTQAQFDALTSYDTSTIYYVTD